MASLASASSPLPSHPSGSQPFFSIVIPTYNRPERLAACLGAIAQLDYPGDRFEVIVVDDGSQLDLKPAVAPFQPALQLSLIQQPNSGPAAARNRGVQAAQGEWIAFTDDDCMPLPSWLSAFAQAVPPVSENGADLSPMLGGKTLNDLTENLYSTASQQLIDYLYEYYNQASKTIQFFASNNIAMRRDRFLEIGGFDVSFPLAAAEDREFCDRWLQHDLTMHYVPTAQIRHAHDLSLTSFWRQHFGYGRGAFYFHQVRAQRNSKPIQVEPLSFYLDLLRYPLTLRSRHGGWVLSSLFFLSQVATTLGFFRERFLGKN
ncbi:MAG: glycosyltransferase [Synechococcales cyanobacterium CRU_2_2]|nr:glycosyltransferase [Synechococcales cyanobacterium CRU_2_2]